MLKCEVKRRGETWVSSEGNHIGAWIGESNDIRRLVDLSNEDEARTNARLGKSQVRLPLDVPAANAAEAVIEQYGYLPTTEDMVREGVIMTSWSATPDIRLEAIEADPDENIPFEEANNEQGEPDEVV